MAARPDCRLWIGAALLILAAAPAAAQQVADSTFHPEIRRPAYAPREGPVVAIDEAHHNFHTVRGRYAPFADLLARDGYRVRAFSSPFTTAALDSIGILVIANALAARNETDWTLPTPSAFTTGEVKAVEGWVARGGSLLLIVDHMPFPGAAMELAAAFGVTFSNGFAIAPDSQTGQMIFRRREGRLADLPLTRGRGVEERVDSLVSFTGSAFRADSTARPVLILPPETVSLEPDTAWRFSDATPRRPVAGWSQGAVLDHGRGRVAVFGEAAMFTAQVAGPNRRRTGMNAPEAPQNARFLLNAMHWLSGMLP